MNTEISDEQRLDRVKACLDEVEGNVGKAHLLSHIEVFMLGQLIGSARTQVALMSTHEARMLATDDINAHESRMWHALRDVGRGAL